MDSNMETDTMGSNMETDTMDSNMETDTEPLPAANETMPCSEPINVEPESGVRYMYKRDPVTVSQVFEELGGESLTFDFDVHEILMEMVTDFIETVLDGTFMLLDHKSTKVLRCSDLMLSLKNHFNIDLSHFATSVSARSECEFEEDNLEAKSVKRSRSPERFRCPSKKSAVEKDLPNEHECVVISHTENKKLSSLSHNAETKKFESIKKGLCQAHSTKVKGHSLPPRKDNINEKNLRTSCLSSPPSRSDISVKRIPIESTYSKSKNSCETYLKPLSECKKVYIAEDEEIFLKPTSIPRLSKQRRKSSHTSVSQGILGKNDQNGSETNHISKHTLSTQQTNIKQAHKTKQKSAHTPCLSSSHNVSSENLSLTPVPKCRHKGKVSSKEHKNEVIAHTSGTSPEKTLWTLVPKCSHKGKVSKEHKNELITHTSRTSSESALLTPVPKCMHKGKVSPKEHTNEAITHRSGTSSENALLTRVPKCMHKGKVSLKEHKKEVITHRSGTFSKNALLTPVPKCSHKGKVSLKEHTNEASTHASSTSSENAWLTHVPKCMHKGKVSSKEHTTEAITHTSRTSSENALLTRVPKCMHKGKVSSKEHTNEAITHASGTSSENALLTRVPKCMHKGKVSLKEHTNEAITHANGTSSENALLTRVPKCMHKGKVSSKEHTNEAITHANGTSSENALLTRVPKCMHKGKVSSKEHTNETSTHASGTSSENALLTCVPKCRHKGKVSSKEHTNKASTHASGTSSENALLTRVPKCRHKGKVSKEHKKEGIAHTSGTNIKKLKNPCKSSVSNEKNAAHSKRAEKMKERTERERSMYNVCVNSASKPPVTHIPLHTRNKEINGSKFQAIQTHNLLLKQLGGVSVKGEDEKIAAMISKLNFISKFYAKEVHATNPAASHRCEFLACKLMPRQGIFKDNSIAEYIKSVKKEVRKCTSFSEKVSAISNIKDSVEEILSGDSADIYTLIDRKANISATLGILRKRSLYLRSHFMEPRNCNQVNALKSDESSKRSEIIEFNRKIKGYSINLSLTRGIICHIPEEFMPLLNRQEKWMVVASARKHNPEAVITTNTVKRYLCNISSLDFVKKKNAVPELYKRAALALLCRNIHAAFSYIRAATAVQHTEMKVASRHKIDADIALYETITGVVVKKDPLPSGKVRAYDVSEVVPIMLKRLFPIVASYVSLKQSKCISQPAAKPWSKHVSYGHSEKGTSVCEKTHHLEKDTSVCEKTHHSEKDTSVCEKTHSEKDTSVCEKTRQLVPISSLSSLKGITIVCREPESFAKVKHACLEDFYLNQALILYKKRKEQREYFKQQQILSELNNSDSSPMQVSETMSSETMLPSGTLYEQKVCYDENQSMDHDCVAAESSVLEINELNKPVFNANFCSRDKTLDDYISPVFFSAEQKTSKSSFVECTEILGPIHSTSFHCPQLSTWQADSVEPRVSGQKNLDVVKEQVTDDTTSDISANISDLVFPEQKISGKKRDASGRKRDGKKINSVSSVERDSSYSEKGKNLSRKKREEEKNSFMPVQGKVSRSSKHSRKNSTASSSDCGKHSSKSVIPYSQSHEPIMVSIPFVKLPERLGKYRRCAKLSSTKRS